MFYELLEFKKVIDGESEYEIIKSIVESEPPVLNNTYFNSILKQYVHSKETS